MKETVDRIRALINQAFAHDGEPLVDEPDADLLGVLDSLQVLRMVVELERTFSIKIGNGEITADNFRTLAALARFVDSKVLLTAG